MNDDRYETVRDTLRAAVRPHRPDSVAVCPPVNREQAQRVAWLIARKFCPKIANRYSYAVDVRRVWISRLPTTASNGAKGLGRLVHDLSHDIFEAVYPSRRPHDPLHVKYETDVAAFVGTSKRIAAILWPELKPKREPKPPPTAQEKRAARLASTVASIKRWESKAKRAATALRKLRASERGLKRAMYEQDAADCVLENHRPGSA